MQTWTTQTTGKEVCEECGAVYSVTITRFPVRDCDSLDCELCGHQMNSWNSTRAPSYTLIVEPQKNEPSNI